MELYPFVPYICRIKMKNNERNHRTIQMKDSISERKLQLYKTKKPMPRKPNKKNDCTEIKICVDDELNDLIEKYQATQRTKGNKMRKPDALVHILTEALS